MADLAKAKELLDSQLAEMKARLEHIESDLAEPMDADSSERAAQMEDDESLEGQAAVVSRRITATQRALLRVEDGSYGECLECGADISEGRLNARPESVLCIACAQKG
ncbi:TraR/DksA family transcriptional regulator [Alteraurantiacibacter aquimixticola]|uniref:TraR/DksA family transcriptional regulator n=1 Tax=Alteraurantiacibacter aquimixticola TaxID=2489173 RepID=A0A4T3EYC2_9SPHN|nr:TraR/DksA family transcriptional regulator [Alteraurantiacibacter aquimixticola]TIX49606.1 TraR/DksA family transcriptional regulator [Alteraurantiacibacter aquimixticola]